MNSGLVVQNKNHYLICKKGQINQKVMEVILLEPHHHLAS